MEFSALPKDEPVKKIPGTECDKETEKADGIKRTAITWADVVKGTIGTKEEKQSSRNKSVLGSLSQNNPVSKDKI